MARQTHESERNRGHGAGRRGDERRGNGHSRHRDAPGRNREPRAQEPQELDEATGLPAHLLSRVREAYGERAETVVAGWQAAGARPVTLRANALKASRDEIARALDEADLAWREVPWYPDAFVMGGGIRERDLWQLDVYREGKVYLQSLSSMLPPLALAPRAGTDVLDMCAAPGGKTSQIAALARGAGGKRPARVTACELSAVRADKLEHNLAKLGATNVQVMRCDARRLDEWFSFDQVLLDAPCSGSGTVHAHDDHAARTLTPELLARVTRSQRALIDRGLTVLKPGGALVYSTCSVLPEENEGCVRWALERHGDCELVGVGLPFDAAEVEGGAGANALLEPAGGAEPSAPFAPADGAEPSASPEAGTLIPTALPCRLRETLTVCPTKLFEGFFVARIKKRG